MSESANKKNKETSIIKAFSLTFSVNALGFIVSALMTLILPAIISPAIYGYWQLYLLYTGYTLYFSFGMTDGAYLRYGGCKYDEVDKSMIKGQFFLILLLNLILDICLLAIFFSTVGVVEKRFTFLAACIAGLICIPRSLILMTLLATNRISENAYAIFFERFGNILGILIVLCFRIKRVEILIYTDLLGKTLSLLLVIFKARDIFRVKIVDYKRVIVEGLENIRSGIKIVLAVLAIVFSVSIVRQNIEANFGIESFAKVSFSLSLSNMFTVFINAVAIVLFPVLKRMKPENQKDVYTSLNTIFVSVLGAALIFYEPIRLILSKLLPAYSDGLLYLGLLFPFFLYDGKMLFLLTTYFKVLRKENMLLLINFMTLVFATILSYVAVFVLKNLTYAVIVLLLVQIFRCINAEVYLSKILNKNCTLDIMAELYLTLAFIVSTQVIGSFRGSVFYLLVYALLILFMRKRIKSALIYMLPSKISSKLKSWHLL